MFYVYNASQHCYAAKSSQGQHDGCIAWSIEDAAAFETRHEAWEFSQNFDDNWQVTEY